MATTTTDLARRAPALIAAVSLASLAACSGGGSGGAPPITLKGASFWLPSSNLDEAALRNIDGGAGGNFGSVIFIDDGFAEFLQEETQSSDGTIFFQENGDNFAIVSTPDGQSPSQYSDIRYLRLEYTSGGERFVQNGIIGRFTSDDLLADASGTALYTGIATSEVLVTPKTGDDFNLRPGDATVSVDFNRGVIDVVLDNFGASAAVGTPFDEVRIDGMTITGGRFGGGTLVVLKSGTPTGDFSGGDFRSSGIFAGWNDSNGTAAGGDIPAELGGAFLAATTDGTVAGRYVAD